MTATALRVSTLATRRMASLDTDMRLLADQFRRCSDRQTRWDRVARGAEQARAFAASHVISVVVVAAGAIGALWFLG